MSETINYTSPCGILIISIGDEMLSRIDFSPVKIQHRQSLNRNLIEIQSLHSQGRHTKSIQDQAFPEPALRKNPAGSVLAQQVRQQLDEYFAGLRQTFDLPIRLRGTAFQQEVWSALQHIPYAEVLSYGQLATAINRPKAQRAVGMACNRNPLPIIVPCHRVVGSKGQLTGYAGGLEMKAYLLQLEKK